MQSDKKTLEIALARPKEETHITERKDGVAKYLKKHMKDFVFDEVKPERLSAIGLPPVFAGVPIPLRKEDLKDMKDGKGVEPRILAENIARVLGIDPHFEYAGIYAEFLEKVFGAKAVKNLTDKGKFFAEKKDFEEACICFRASLALDFKNIAGMYGYARVLRELYDKSENVEEIGTLKAEAFSYFELITEFYPKFESGWYYLGYMYLNMGLYAKAGLCWQRFLKESRIMKDKKEIRERLRQIEEPIQIEAGCNAALSGRWAEALDILQPYKESKFNDWWPLWYYLGECYAHLGDEDAALSSFKETLRYNPRHIETMNALIEIYKARGDKENIKKYEGKVQLLSKQ